MIVRVPGDKSITQRALLLAALAEGESRLRGLLAGADPRSTAGALRAMGAGVPDLPADGGEIRIQGRGLRGLGRPGMLLDLGNSGTGARLLMGVLAALPGDAVLTGDASLRSRPMRRVTDPLAAMGGAFEFLEEDGRLPVRVRGGALRPVQIDLPVASAQVKSALLLAGLVGGVFVLLREPHRSRDHSERMLTALGAPVTSHAVEGLWAVELRDPPDRLRPLDMTIPGDLSSAAFFLVWGLLGGGEVTVAGVGLNPGRTGVLPILERMGAGIAVEPAGDHEGEPVGSLTVRPTALRCTEVGAAEVPAAIDELPLVAVAAARAEGVTRIRGAGELRHKETDRLRALVENLRAVGVQAGEFEDGLEVEGTDRPLEGRVRCYGDHRIAMAFGILGALPGNDVSVDDPACVDVSFPDFWQRLDEAGRP